jgi:hypothetical protein
MRYYEAPCQFSKSTVLDPCNVEEGYHRLLIVMHCRCSHESVSLGCSLGIGHVLDVPFTYLFLPSFSLETLHTEVVPGSPQKGMDKSLRGWWGVPPLLQQACGS